MIGDDIRLSHRMADAVSANGELELFTQDLSITTFRYVPPALRASRHDAETAAYLDGLNTAILDAIQRSGEAFVSNAVVRGRYALRACIINFHTAAADVDAVPKIAVAHGRRLDSELRPPALR
jgi:glutamate/tyrosine decarboxylase-like PLP-dependent enzyme